MHRIDDYAWGDEGLDGFEDGYEDIPELDEQGHPGHRYSRWLVLDPGSKEFKRVQKSLAASHQPP